MVLWTLTKWSKRWGGPKGGVPTYTSFAQTPAYSQCVLAHYALALRPHGLSLLAGYGKRWSKEKAQRPLSVRKAAETRKRRRATTDGSVPESTQQKAGILGSSADDVDNSAGSSDTGSIDAGSSDEGE